MPLNVVKPIDRPEHISILFPTRGRPAFVEALFDSIAATVRRADLLDAWAYVDADDAPTIECFDRAASAYPFAIHAVTGPGVSNGEMHNVLRQRCSTNPGIYMYAGDKFVFRTPGWDEIVRAAFCRYPDRILLAYPKETRWMPILGAFGVYGFLSAEWTNVLGRLFTEYFSFWFDDTWLNQVATMVQRSVTLDMEVAYQDKRHGTRRMRNLPFWQRFFEATMDERLREADALRRAAYGQGTQACRQSLAAGQALARAYLDAPPPDLGLRQIEKRNTIFPRRPPAELVQVAAEAERRAVRHLVGKVVAQGAGDRPAEGFAALDAVLRASEDWLPVGPLREFVRRRLGRARSGAARGDEALHRALAALLPEDMQAEAFLDAVQRVIGHVDGRRMRASVRRRDRGDTAIHRRLVRGSLRRLRAAVQRGRDAVRARRQRP